jgi:hypothetical protein
MEGIVQPGISEENTNDKSEGLISDLGDGNDEHRVRQPGNVQGTCSTGNNPTTVPGVV